MTVPNPPTPGSPSPRGRARLVQQGEKEVLSGLQEVDVRLAMTRGLAEYIQDLRIDVPGGRRVRFRSVHEEYAEPEEPADMPAAAVLLSGPGTYEARSLTPGLDPKERLPQPDGRYLVVPADYVQDVTVECWTNDPAERSAAVMMLERAFLPHAWRYGFSLELPYYFSNRVTYSLKDLTIRDDADNSQRRIRVAVFTLAARAPLIVPFSFPDARPRFELASVGTGEDVLLTLEVT